MFGGITIICGILGTLAGGFVLDLIQSTISNAFKVQILLLEFLDHIKYEKLVYIM